MNKNKEIKIDENTINIKLETLVKYILGPDIDETYKISLTESLSSMGFDEIDTEEFITSIEDLFDINIDDEVANNFENMSINQIKPILLSKIKKAGV